MRRFVEAYNRRDFDGINALMPPPVRAIRAEELIGGCAGMRPQQTQRYLVAASIRPETPLGDLSPPQRTALAGALRLRRG